MTPEEITAATSDIEDNFPDIDFETRTQFVDYVTSRYEFLKVRTRQQLIEELAGLEMDEIDATT